MAKNQWIIEDYKPAKIEPQRQASFGQQLGAIPVQATRGLEDLLNFAGSIFGEPSMPGYQPEVSLETPQISALSQLVQSQLGVPQQALEPENPLLSGIQRFARGVPGAALSGLVGGPSVLQNLAGLGLGSSAAAGAKLLGASEPVQDLLQLGTELKYGLKSGRIPSIKKAQQIEDQLARAAVKSGTRVAANEITQALAKVESGLATEVSEKYAGKLRHTLESITNNLSKDKIDPTVAMDLRKKLYKLSAELPSHVNAEYIQPLTNGINKFFATYAAENPTFYKHLSARDKLTQIKNMEPVLSQFIDSFKLKNVPLANLLASSTKKIFGEGERVARGVFTNPAARKVYFNMIKGAAQNDPSLVAKNITQLIKIMPELKEEKQSHWIIED